MSEKEKLVQVAFNIGADTALSQAEIEEIVNRLQAQVAELRTGPVDIIGRYQSGQGSPKGEIFITLAVAALQFVVPKLLEIAYDMIKQYRNNRIKVIAQVGGKQAGMDCQTDDSQFHQISETLLSEANTGEIPDKRYALLIGATHYQDNRLNQLASPEEDIEALSEVLRDSEIGGYDDVKLLLNESSLVVQQQVEQFYKRKANTDMLLLYYSGHGIRGEDDELYLATQNTNLETLRSTSLSADFVKGEMDRSKSERQILILDCCYSGAFTESGKKAAAVGVPVNAGNVFKGNGFGRVIITASGKTQVAWEGKNVMGEVNKSVFTGHLVNGLRSGEADNDRDGWVGLEELYKYVYNRMVRSSGDQTPLINVYDMQGSIFLARNPRPRAIELDPELQSLMKSSRSSAREAAVRDLSQLLQDPHYGTVIAARQALEKLAEDDSLSVREAARSALGLKTGTEKHPSPSIAVNVPVTSPPPEPAGRGTSLTKDDFPPIAEPVVKEPESEPAAKPNSWWKNLSPNPDTRQGVRSKSGPAAGDVQAGNPAQDAVNSFSNPAAPAAPPTAAAPASLGDRLREPDMQALVMGILSLVLFFLPPVALAGVIVGRRAMQEFPDNPRAKAGFILSVLVLAVQVVFIVLYMVG